MWPWKGQTLLERCLQRGLARTHAIERTLLRDAPAPALLTHRHEEGLSTGRGGMGGWKGSWFYKRSLKVLGLFSLGK